MPKGSIAVGLNHLEPATDSRDMWTRMGLYLDGDVRVRSDGHVYLFGSFSRSGDSDGERHDYYLGGLRLKASPFYGFTPFAHVMVGAERLRTISMRKGMPSAGSFAYGGGLGIDLNLASHFSFRVAQFDAIVRTSPYSEEHWRYSTGLVFRF